MDREYGRDRRSAADRETDINIITRYEQGLDLAKEDDVTDASVEDDEEDTSLDAELDLKDTTYDGQPISNEIIFAIENGKRETRHLKREARRRLNRDLTAFCDNFDVSDAYEYSPMEEEKVGAVVEQFNAPDLCSLQYGDGGHPYGHTSTDLGDANEAIEANTEKCRRITLRNGCLCDTANQSDDECDSVSSGYSEMLLFSDWLIKNHQKT